MEKHTERIHLSFPEFQGNELSHVMAAMDEGKISTHGEFIEAFEQRLAGLFQAEHVVAINSGTSAIHLALHLLGVGHGDEVLCQSFTFIASTNPIVYQGANPVLVDSERDTWNMCPDILEETIKKRLAIGKRPKAILVVNLFGMPAKWGRIREISQKYQIPVIEDAAEAVGSAIRGQHAGTFGDLGIFSFNGNKIITTGSGGALLTDNRFMAKKASYLSTQAKLDYPHYEHSELGFNYKMNNIAAGIGLAQLEALQDRVARRRFIYQRYKKYLQDLPGIQFLDEPQGYFSNRWLTTLLIQPQETGFSARELMLTLGDQNIESRLLWKPMHLQPLYRQSPFYGTGVSAALFSQGICLPSSTGLSDAEMGRVLDVIFSLHGDSLRASEKML
ncbi:dTDP-4-amino-4,6-dideoxygalactose transaminase [Cyclobacterium lianum]|uniref:dTDP-4-amino-4,6-dideoxygalactose transaminase n=1 Tax=Cyclobacterium lianum TaxID=388280 RepID=A0A1M7PE28_9BACT|nr:aminotransferase class I/II-fold pyridoxal phosphate-dependent enzyme [Cyclobacterium lianum]SHN15200.1 dTDP-4-amino-4,6-dideoxygalactose transaminase [Cyclobacterium lianum]